jgi:hypothetical protein
MPGGELVERQAVELERQLLAELKRRLEAVESSNGNAPPPAREPLAEPASAADETPERLLRALLQTSMEQTREQSQTAYFIAVLKSLVPDEARILAALSDGSTYPLIHVAEDSLVGASGRGELENVSSVGRSAGVLWPDMVPSYVGHLRALGLAETGPEDPAAQVKYEMLETDNAVRQATLRIGRSSRQRRGSCGGRYGSPTSRARSGRPVARMGDASLHAERGM